MLNVNKLYHNNRDKVCGSKVHRRVCWLVFVSSLSKLNTKTSSYGNWNKPQGEQILFTGIGSTCTQKVTFKYD